MEPERLFFIHGVGNGTLKLELRKELSTKYKKYYFQDASFKGVWLWSYDGDSEKTRNEFRGFVLREKCNSELVTRKYFDHLCSAERSIAALPSGEGEESPGNTGYHASLTGRRAKVCSKVTENEPPGFDVSNPGTGEKARVKAHRWRWQHRQPYL